MIEPAEIEAKARDFEIHTSNVQRDYVFGWLLFGLFTISDLKDQLFLKGGNALRKGYFENTRFSTDLDLGIPSDARPEVLAAEINKVCSAIQDRAGIIFATQDTRVEQKFTAAEAPLPDLKVYEARVYFKDFYGHSEHIKLRVSMDITRFDRVLLPIQRRQLIHPYSDAQEITCEIRCMKLEEIIATKLKCLMQRQHAPDLFDYAYSIKLLGGELDKQEVARTLIRKTIFARNPFVLKQILLKLALAYFREEWRKSVVCAKQFFIEVDDAIASFMADLEVLFAPYPNRGFMEFAYFGADLRAPIMHAGRTQTLLRIRYKGEERFVEPYSLKYQRRRDGMEREYFFAYKIAGGNSAPGIKMFTADRMSSIDNTDTKFVPRFQIELSKAGEMPEKRHLFDPNRPTRPPRSRRVASGSQMKYVYRCNYCGKRFIRSNYNATLRPHKNRNGTTCYGTYGIYVGTKFV